ncbi:MAG: hypothetical protein ACHQ3P_00440 [Candidatus Limnocylindrales bacterium]
MDPEYGTTSDAGDAGVSNTCEYAGQVYTEGSIVCMAGNEYRCMNLHGRSYTWEPTGRPCAAPADPGGTGQDPGAASQDSGSQGWGDGGSTDEGASPSQESGDSGGG